MNNAAQTEGRGSDGHVVTAATTPSSSVGSSSAPVAGAGMLIALQAGSRLVTLLLAQVQVRMTSAEAFGAAHIHLELLLGTILTFAREGIRNALSRQTIVGLRPSSDEKGSANQDDDDEDDDDDERQWSIRNVALLPLPVGVLIAALVMTTYRARLAPDSLTSHTHFSTACNVFLTGALLELASEPLYIDALRHVCLGPRVWAEGAGVLAKGIGTLAAMVYLQRCPQSPSRGDELKRSLLPFGVGQLCYGAAFLAVFVFKSVRRRGLSHTLKLYRPQTPTAVPTFDRASMTLSISMTRQNIVKHVLGEADKFAVARLATLGEQGAYALASNYGSLVARLLYQPLEESARLTFATTLAARQADDEALNKTSEEKKRQSALETAQTLLRNLLAFYALLAIFLILFCPPLAVPALLLVAGPRWALQTSAPRILTVYGSTYLPAMAFNGLLEGFLQACASPAQLARYDGVLIFASVLFFAALAGTTAAVPWPWLLSGVSGALASPEVALVQASAISTWVRAVYSYAFAQRYFQQQHQQSARGQLTFRTILPGATFLAVSALLAAVLYRSAYAVPIMDWQWPWWRSSAAAQRHVLLATSCGLIALLACVTLERRTLAGALQAVRGHRDP